MRPRDRWGLGLLLLAFVGLLLLVPSVTAVPTSDQPASPAAPLAPPPPYLIHGTVWQPGGAVAVGATVWVNDTTVGPPYAAPVTTDGSGHYQLDLANAYPSYSAGDFIRVQAIFAPYNGTNSTTVVEPAGGAPCNVSLVFQPLVAGLRANPTTVFVGQTVHFNASATGGAPPFQYNWTFGDGATATTYHAVNFTTHAYATAATFTADVAINGSVGHGVAAPSRTITVLPVPTLTLSGPSSALPGAPLAFTGTLSIAGNDWIYFFDFGDGSNSGYLPVGTHTASHSYALPGSYPVNVTAYNTSTNFRVDSAPSTVVILPPLSVALAVTPSPTEARVATSFSGPALHATGPVTYGFTFGDGTSATEHPNDWNATHTYRDAGNYTANVTATQGSFPPVTASQLVPVLHHVGLSLQSSFSGPLITPLHVEWEARGFAGLGPYTYSLQLGDGVSYSGNLSGDFNTTYLFPGSYMVNATVADALGALAWSNQTLVVRPPPLTVTATATPASAVEGTSVTFSAVASGGYGSDTFLWNFSDGTPSASGATVHHTFLQVGTFDVTVEASDQATPVDTANFTVAATVTKPAPLSFVLSGPATGDAGNVLGYQLTITGGLAPYDVDWLFGDGTGGQYVVVHSTAAFENHTFSKGGTYVLTVFVNDSESPAQSATPQQLTITISQPAPPPTLTTQLSPGGTLFPFLLLLLLVVVAVVVLLAYVRRRKRKEEEKKAAEESYEPSPTEAAAAGASAAGAAAGPAPAVTPAPAAEAPPAEPAPVAASPEEAPPIEFEDLGSDESQAPSSQDWKES